jgi:hypothetical protein
MANFVRVPPDSTGKKVRHSRKITVVLTITNQSKASTIQRGDLISGTISGAEGFFTGRAATNAGFSYYLDLDTNEVFQIGDVPVGGGSDSADYGLDTVKKKEISLHVKIEDGTVYNKTIIVDNINLSVRSIKQEDNHIFLSVSDITSEDRKIELIKVDILD